MKRFVQKFLVRNIKQSEERAFRSKNNQFVFILGMHRSGTSCMAASLERCGLYLGKVSSADPYNLKGNHELQEVWWLHDEILTGNNGSWSQPPNKILINHDQTNAIKRIVKKLSKHKPCGVKDPRLLLLINFWLPIVNQYTLVGSFRHPAAVAKSLYKRDAIPIKEGHKLWVVYNEKLIQLHKKYQFPLIEFGRSSVDEYCREISFIAETLGLKPDISKVREFIDPGLIHESSLSNSVPEICHEIYAYLQNNCYKPD